MMCEKKSMKPKTEFRRFQSQQGWTIWSMVFVMSVVFVLAYIGMNLVPMFSANQSVEAAMRNSVENKDLRSITRRQVVGEMNKLLYIDNNHELLDYKNDLRVTRAKNKFVIEAEYEREIKLVANLVLVARFNPRVECELTGRCDP